MSTIIKPKKDELMNLSKEELRELIKPNVNLKVSWLEQPIILTGKETIEDAAGGEFRINEGIDVTKREPAGIRLLNGDFVSILSIEEILTQD